MTATGGRTGRRVPPLSEGDEIFEKQSIEGGTRRDGYLRQLPGSARSGAMRSMTGNLSHQLGARPDERLDRVRTP